MPIGRLIKSGTKVTHKKSVVEDNNDLITTVEEIKEKPKTEKKSAKNNERKNNKKMMTEEQIASAENMANVLSDTKVIKKDKGLIERTESSKIILTEDNRQLLND